MFSSMSHAAILETLGGRAKQERLNQNLPQATLAEKAGVSVTVVKRLEGGKGCSLANFVKILRVLDKLETLDMLLPESGPSPIELARLSGKVRKEAGGRRGRPSRKMR